MKAFYTRGLTHARTCATDTKTSAERTPPHSRRPGSPARVPVVAARALASGERGSLPTSRPVCLLQGSLHPASRSRPARVRRLPHPGGVATSMPRSGGLAVQLGPPPAAHGRAPPMRAAWLCCSRSREAASLRLQTRPVSPGEMQQREREVSAHAPGTGLRKPWANPAESGRRPACR